MSELYACALCDCGDDVDCDAGYSTNGEHAHWNVYASDGEEHTFCGWAWQDHYKCCRDADADHGNTGYAYADTLIAYNIRKGCEGGDTGDATCDGLLAAAEARRAKNPKAVWSDVLTGRLDNWPVV